MNSKSLDLVVVKLESCVIPFLCLKQIIKHYFFI